MSHRVRVASVLVAAIVAVSVPAHAQSGVTVSDSVAGPAVAALPAPSLDAPSRATERAPVAAPLTGPALDAAVAGARPASFVPAAGEDALAPMRRAATTNNKALMIVGGAAFVAGALIGGDAGTIVMVGGAAVGLYGLYKYLQ